MRSHPKLPRYLRLFFAALQAVTVLFALFWVLNLTFNTWIQKRFVDQPKLLVSIGELSVSSPHPAVPLHSDTAKPGSLTLADLGGRLQTDLLSDDAALVSALRWTLFPSLAITVLCSWLLFGSLRALCGNIERGDLFTETNFQLVRRVGLILIASTLVAFAVQLWAANTMDSYLNQHGVLASVDRAISLPDTPARWHFSLSFGPFFNWGGLVTGLLVLMVSEAFRQGQNLKAENDLTV